MERKRWFAGTAALLLCVPMLLGMGPCGPIAGGALSGEVHGVAVDDWSFVNDVPRCAVEVRPSDPHSVTVNCMSWQKRLFVSCSECEPKRWSSMALADANGRIEIAGKLYPVTLSRVRDAKQLDAVWQARLAKVGEDSSEPRPAGWWTFELTSRAPE